MGGERRHPQNLLRSFKYFLSLFLTKFTFPETYECLIGAARLNSNFVICVQIILFHIFFFRSISAIHKTAQTFSYNLGNETWHIKSCART